MKTNRDLLRNPNPLLAEFGEDGSSDVEEPTVDVGVCKADRFVADEAEEAVKGEKRGRGEEGERG